jgi:hypothetical protein
MRIGKKKSADTSQLIVPDGRCYDDLPVKLLTIYRDGVVITLCELKDGEQFAEGLFDENPDWHEHLSNDPKLHGAVCFAGWWSRHGIQVYPGWGQPLLCKGLEALRVSI